ncbi:Proton/glutamate-aspartate symporter [Sinobacterium norvegicum]|uniref:Proton/glutamate-aspartate symporter n=1 Tax=Sinobacterium norvegicum TaxID=1641715 RepID=A0ABN8EHR9_9GAMM|nr:dicarboxylate/amino acid:cation symporter [Sinobacterium norvegicum]CAH0990882.1 Proton/glutamate-aspartate symporter [Sinobacterium norvegicum]
MKKSLSHKIFIGLVSGLILGSIIQYMLAGIPIFDEYLVGTASAVGTMFVSLIKLMVVPLVFVSIVAGICELDSTSQLGRLGGKISGLYFANTVLAVVVAMVIAYILQPGSGANLGEAGAGASALTEQGLPNVGQMIVNIIPDNPIAAFASGDMLQIIFMAIVVAIAIKSLGDYAKPAQSGFAMANDIMMRLITMVMNLAPYGVFALMINLGATLEMDSIISVAGYVAIVVSILFAWILIVYPLAVWMFTGIKPSVFRAKTREQVLFSLSTASSNATIPVTTRTLVEKFGVSKALAGFGVPLGATINMSGAAIYIAVAAVFATNAYGVTLSPAELITIGATVCFMSVGVGGVPGGAVVMIAVLIQQFGLPIEALAIVAAVDRINDMVCTSANVVGDAAVVTIVAGSEGELDHDHAKDINATSKPVQETA